MGVCCIKGNHHLNDLDSGHRKRHNQTNLINKDLFKNYDSIFTTQTKSHLSHFNTKAEPMSQNDAN